MLTVSDDKTAVIWDVRPGQALNVMLQHRTSVPSAKFNRDGDKVVTAAGGNVYIWNPPGDRAEAAVWDARTGELVAPRIKASAGVQYAEFSPDGRRIVTASKDLTARIWDAQTGAPVTDPLRHSGKVHSARFNPEGRRVVTASDDKTARIWDAQSGQLLIDLVHSEEVRFAEFSPDGQWILTVSRTARVWDAQTGQATKQEFLHDDISDARFSRDGRCIVTASFGGTTRLWDRHTGKPLTEPFKHQSPVRSARFSPDGRYVVTASEDQTARIWNALTGEPATEPLVHKGAVLSAEFSHDGQRVVTASEDGTARVWDIQTGRPLTEPLPQNGWVPYAEFSPDGNRIIASVSNGSVRIWELASVEVPVPEWTLDLAEAIVGQRLLDQETPEHVLQAQFLTLKHRLLEASETNRYTTWAKWLLANRMTRNTSPSSSVSSSKYLERLMEAVHFSPEDSERSLREAVHFSPENAVAVARLARQVLAKKDSDHPHKMEEVEFLSRFALKLNPDQPEAWSVKAELLEHTGRLTEALPAMDRAIALKPDSGHWWHLKGQWLEKASRDPDALHAYSQAVDLIAATPRTPSKVTETSEDLKTVLFRRAKLLERMGRLKESGDDNLRARGIPQRDPEATPEQIDLSIYYNAALTDTWDPKIKDGNDLASLPRGLHTLAGVRWDLRGLIQIGRESRSGEPNPKQVSGIPVGFACQRVHFLHSAIDAYDLNEVQIGSYMAHFADGRQIEIPIAVGRDLKDWWSQPDEEGKPFVIAWTDTNKDSAAQGRTIRLFKTTWESPFPEVPLRSIDLVSTHEWAAPFVVAITAERTSPHEVSSISPQKP